MCGYEGAMLAQAYRYARKHPTPPKEKSFGEKRRDFAEAQKQSLSGDRFHVSGTIEGLKIISSPKILNEIIKLGQGTHLISGVLVTKSFRNSNVVAWTEVYAMTKNASDKKDALEFKIKNFFSWDVSISHQIFEEDRIHSLLLSTVIPVLQRIDSVKEMRECFVTTEGDGIYAHIDKNEDGKISGFISYLFFMNGDSPTLS